MGSEEGWHSLICHPDTPSAGVDSVAVHVSRDSAGDLTLIYFVDAPGGMRLPEGKVQPTYRPRNREDGLWKTTCFELFVMPVDGPNYVEFNFSPSGSFAAYAFDGYRSGMRPADIEGAWDADDVTWDGRYQMTIAPLSLDWGEKDWKLALSAVIEETDGTKSYWALRHPPGAPDFHHPDCFALTLEAPPPA